MRLADFRKENSSTQCWRQNADSICPFPEGEALLASSLIIPRQQLLYQCLDFSEVPKGVRQRVLNQQLQRLSPFKQTAKVVLHAGDYAQLWLWDAQRQHTLLRASDAPAKIDAIPEPLLHKPMTDGFLQQTCMDGWELQHWQQGVLRQSQWLPRKPEQTNLDEFQRGVGAIANDPHWHQADLVWLPAPWSEQPFWSKQNLLSEPVLSKLLAATLLCWLALQLGLGLGTQLQQQNLQQTVDNKHQQLMALVDQRASALNQLALNEGLKESIGGPTQLQLAVELHRRLEDHPFVILDWQFQRGQLKVLLQQDDLDTRAVIEALSASVLFTEVHAEPGLVKDQSLLILTVAERNAVSERSIADA